MFFSLLFVGLESSRRTEPRSNVVAACLRL